MTLVTPPPMDEHTLSLIRMAVREDMGPAGARPRGDRTVELAIPAELRGTGTIVARRDGVISGTYLLPAILQEYDPGIACEIVAADGTKIGPQQGGGTVAVLRGPMRGILSAERVLLNFLGHLSGVATLTRRYVDAIADVPAPRPVVCDTRKTTPAFRALDKYAVRCGGGVNHRMGLYDGVMLKDNHLAALREKLGETMTLAELTETVRKKLESEITLWLEVDTLAQLREALSLPGPAGVRRADIILLDNFTVEEMRAAVALRDAAVRVGGPKVLLEASGGVTLETLPAIARTGVDRISIGALTHSAPVLDLSMEVA